MGGKTLVHTCLICGHESHEDIRYDRSTGISYECDCQQKEHNVCLELLRNANVKLIVTNEEISFELPDGVRINQIITDVDIRLARNGFKQFDFDADRLKEAIDYENENGVRSYDDPRGPIKTSDLTPEEVALIKKYCSLPDIVFDDIKDDP